MKAAVRRIWRNWQGRKLKRCIASFEMASLQQLRSLEWVEGELQKAGLKYLPPPHGAVFGKDERWMNFHSDGLFQIPRQLARFMILAAEHSPSSLIEIGTNNGWTACVLTGYLRRFVPRFQAVTLDVVDHFALRSWATKNLPLQFSLGQTSDDFKGRAFDLCFIDGDHSWEWVSRDYENVGRFARVCAFHDINDAATDRMEGGGSSRHWAWLKATRGNAGAFHEILDHSDSKPVMGIGVFIQIRAPAGAGGC
jgi:hypothetical protein